MADDDAAADEAVARLTARRARIRAWWRATDAWADDADAPVGLALSGGGIRSATFSLGLLQGLARAERTVLDRIDILSTVSGGGYIGCFFRSLFVPTAARGIDRDVVQPDATILSEQYGFARAALGSPPNARRLDYRGQTLRNPLWWLREHSRYLAPTGPSDYAFAIAYVARNWLAMIYLFTLACATIGAGVVGVEAGLLAHLGRTWTIRPGVSPTIALAPVLLFAIGALGIGYWATQAMSPNERNVWRQLRRLWQGVAAIVIAAGIAAGAVSWVAARFPARIVDLFGPRLGLVVAAGLAMSVVGALTAGIVGLTFWRRRELIAAELRLDLTNGLALAGKLLLLLAGVIAVDTLAAWLGSFRLIGPGSLSIRWAALLPAFAFLIKKLPDWLGGTGRGGIVGPLLHRFAPAIALVAGLLLYGALAVGALALVHHVAWRVPWQSAPNWPGLAALAVVLLVLALVSGTANGFINLSSLHTLYASRLTRAYLGASNRERLLIRQPHGAPSDDGDRLRRARHPHPVTENHPCDYIQPQVYGQTDLPAPVHIINTTLNETIDVRSQIVSRDRKGDILSLEPDGVRIGRADLYDWSRLTNTPPEKDRKHAENVSLGQWCAISGAAASSGMGRMSSLGFALAFTFANIRLGYWWWAPDLCPDWPRASRIAAPFGTFVYLWNEMTCRYSRGYDRKYLTDGGHYENSGAYVLVRRGVPLILVADNGADPAYAFEDMQVLIRQVRIDLGAETEILGGVALDAFLKTLGTRDHSIFVDPDADPDWQQTMRNPRAAAFVLVLRAVVADRPVHLVWIKPRLLPGMPDDLAGYAALTGSFPQQSTGEQFFDEAQWESYRRLGEESINRLLAACPALLAWAPRAA